MTVPNYNSVTESIKLNIVTSPRRVGAETYAGRGPTDRMTDQQTLHCCMTDQRTDTITTYI